VWVGATGLQFTGLKKKLEALPLPERTVLGHFLVDVAAADGNISPDEITTLTKLYGMLGLDEKAVYSAIHAMASGEDRPVTVRAADEDTRHAIPEPIPAGVQIDLVRLNARRAETAEVAALLSSVFTEDEPENVAPPATLQAEHSALGLDAAHSALFETLCAQQSWTRVELEALVESYGLALVDAAIDRINEAAIEHCNEPILEGEGPWELNDYALEAIS
jgi:hypothetical protein